jgi:hypothetical protein
LGAHRCGVGMSLLSALVPSSFLSGSSPHWPYSFPPEPSTRIASNLEKTVTESTRREPVPLTPGVGAALVVHREAMPPADGRLDDPDAGEGVDGVRAALRLGIRRVAERAALVPPPREELRDTGDPSQTEQELGQGARKAGVGGGGKRRGRTRPSWQMARELRLPATTAVTA